MSPWSRPSSRIACSYSLSLCRPSIPCPIRSRYLFARNPWSYKYVSIKRKVDSKLFIDELIHEMNLHRKMYLDASNWHPDRIPILSLHEMLEYQRHSIEEVLWLNYKLRTRYDRMLSQPGTTKIWQKQTEIFLLKLPNSFTKLFVSSPLIQYFYTRPCSWVFLQSSSSTVHRTLNTLTLTYLNQLKKI